MTIKNNDDVMKMITIIIILIIILNMIHNDNRIVSPDIVVGHVTSGNGCLFRYRVKVMALESGYLKNGKSTTTYNNLKHQHLLSSQAIYNHWNNTSPNMNKE